MRRCKFLASCVAAGYANFCQRPSRAIATEAAASEKVLVTGGNSAQEIERQSDEQIGDQLMAVLRNIYSKQIPEPEALKITRWNSDLFACSSYSRILPHALPADFEAMAEPVGDRLYFAGEASSSKYYGTVHGACLSGFRKANHIIKLLAAN
ncbi:MAG: FAD-dependent oxidoreductase [Planctomycetales bacterium]